MKSVSEGIGVEKTDSWQAIFFGGLIAGTLDITAASISVWIKIGQGPFWTFQSVAGGIYGRDTFEGGWRTAALGLFLHFLIATTATTAYYLASRKLKFLIDQAIICGILYGIWVWLFMNFVVIPLTPLKFTYSVQSVITGLLIHIFCIGLPIALIVRRFSK